METTEDEARGGKMGNISTDAEVLEAIEKTEKNRKWIARNYDKLRTQYEGRVFAVKDENVLESSDNVEHLLENVSKKGEDTALLVIESIPRKGVAYIL
ncbi:MAG: hypothetical protein JRM99_09010 [Nitrososphaerota archaeon]|nr:hypothetical protein [Nitrososphaerota archaeon]